LAGTEDQGDFAFATVIGCSDSRAPVELIFDAGVMEIFTIRVAGNVVDSNEAGSAEYGVAHVKTPVVVILGHTQCGAVTAATRELDGRGRPLERNIQPLLDNIFPAVRRSREAYPDLHGDDSIPKAIEENVWQAMTDLFMISPEVRRLAAEGRVKVVGGIYDLETGRVAWLPEERAAEILALANKNPDRVVGDGR
jgi:carbonic anhydrase